MSEAAPVTVDPTSCSSEGCSAPQAKAEAAICPVSRTIGLKVDLITVRALLTGNALRRLKEKAYHFCPEPVCNVVYFCRKTNSVFKKIDLEVRVGQKEADDPIPICYCFDITVADLRKDITTAGETNIPAMITAEVKAGHCACDVKNPQGSCCLGNVSKAIAQIQFEHGTLAPCRARVAGSLPAGSGVVVRNPLQIPGKTRLSYGSTPNSIDERPVEGDLRTSRHRAYSDHENRRMLSACQVETAGRVSSSPRLP